MKTRNRDTRPAGMLAAAALLVAMASPALAAFELSLSPSSVTVEVGQKFIVWVDVVDCPAFLGAQWYVEFDNTLLQHPSAADQGLGTLNPAADWNTLLTDDLTGDSVVTPGSAKLGPLPLPIPPNAGGTGTLGRFIFTATAAGSTTITARVYEDPAYMLGTKVDDGTTDYVPTIVSGQVSVTINDWTPVVMADASARSAGVGAVVEWTTQSEIDNVGFDVLRRRAGAREWRRVTGRPIDGRLTAVGPATYRYLDLTAPGRYEYCIETIATDGRRERHVDPGMAVTVRPGEVLGSLGELPGLLGDRADGIVDDVRSKAVTALRRKQLAAKRAGARNAPCRRRGRLPAVRVLASTAERSSTAGRGAGRATTMRRPPGGTIARTRGDGVFFVPASTLPGAPERIELVASGARSLPLRRSPEGIWFFAPAHDDPYTDLGATFLVEGAGRGGASPPRRDRKVSGRDAVSVARAVARAEVDGMYAIGAVGCPDPWLYPHYLNSRSPEQTVSVDMREHGGGPVTLRVAVFGYTHDADVDPDHELIVSVNGEAAADLTWDGTGYRVFEMTLTGDAVREGANTVGLTTPPSPAIPRGHGILLDYVEIDYRRSLSISYGPLALEVDRPCTLEVRGIASMDLWAVEVDSQNRGRLAAVSFEGRGESRAALLRAREGYAYYLATAEQVRAPEETAIARAAPVVGPTAYLAVGPEEFREAMEPLLALRRAEGLSAAYVSLGEAVDTYGWGRYGADAVAGLVRAVSPEYVVLVGDNGYDYRNRTGRGVDPMVPAILVVTSVLCETNADALYGDLDGDGVPDVPVGRLPVRTVEELEALVAKTVGRGAPASGASGVLFADRADKSGDFAAAQRRVAEGFPEIDWTELYLDIHGDNASIRSRLTESVNMGTDLVVYQGHGSISWLAKRVPLVDTDEAALWTSSPVTYLSTCWSAFIQSNTESAVSIAEVFLRSDVGPVATVGSTTPCTQDDQERLLQDFLAETLGGGKTIGKAMVSAQRRAADRAANASSDEARGTAMDTVRCYAVLGDPAARILDFGD